MNPPRFVPRARFWLTLAAIAMIAVYWFALAGCASTRIDPASNTAKVDTQRTPSTETVRIRVGGADVKTEAK